ncbi:hypothetical protein BAUCODRAFT_118624 [Baudoinia panamericana UAMH 10762]|uniref:Uncharacterized protein n=1 Tax=Baudoinia panamericana (strain UAMH 10762) TaxID=717646 RepID=M2NMZ9_BAUPA|nr:uncharacterized protein BAUCODRAFT_118624 [Baudoinia panamericana UAMH 10762]EMD00900.1 hypothetical protein BAUCODRAFT_118624 [Baudoinia panamericana UAMH 10762]
MYECVLRPVIWFCYQSSRYPARVKVVGQELATIKHYPMMPVSTRLAIKAQRLSIRSHSPSAHQ